MKKQPNAKVLENGLVIDPREVRQANAITMARYEMSATQQDIIFYLLSILKPTDTAGTEYTICLKELEAKTNRTWNHKQLRESTATMASRVYEFTDEIAGTGKKRITQSALIASAVYIEGEAKIHLEISNAIRPYLMDIKTHFTSYNLQSALTISSKYAKRLYQYCSQYRDLGTFTITIDELKYRLHLKDPKGIEPEQYEKVSALQKYVLDIAKEQINEFTDLKIDYELIKSGRKFVKIRFSINKQKLTQLPLEFETEAETVYSPEKIALMKEKLINSNIVSAKIHKEILSSPILMEKAFKIFYDWSTNPEGARKINNRAAYLLKMLGIK